MRYQHLRVDTLGDASVRVLRMSGSRLGSVEASELIAAIDELVEDRAVRVVILCSSGPDFCAGPDETLVPASFAVDPAAALARLRPPVVAVVQGRCESVGFELALAADLRVASEDATFCFPDLMSGRLPCWGGSQRLPRALGHARAAELLLLGRRLDSAEALAAGLIGQRCAAAELDAAVAALAEQLRSVGPLALELAKEAVHRGSELPLRDGLRLEGDLNHLLAVTDDRAEGLAAFFAKRPPDFAGR